MAPSGYIASAAVNAVLLVAVSGCDQGGQPAPPNPAEQPAEEVKPRLTLLADGWDTWSREEATGRLGDEQAGLSAAVRLVRLAEARPLCVPAELTDQTVRELRLVPLSESLWALGLADRQSERVLRAPVLIASDGQVQLVAGGVEEELLTLHVSEDADIFPHLLITPRRVLVAELPLEAGIELKSPPTVGFAAREQDGYPYVGLMLHGEDGWTEVTRYLWEPYELGLAGPAMDALPDPPGGKFQMNMAASPLLIPVGGEIPAPEPLDNEPPPMMDFEIGEEDA